MEERETGMEIKRENSGTAPVLLGIDIGSTTTKIAALEEGSGKLLYADYRRHHAEQKRSVIQALKEFDRKFPGSSAFLAMTGSGAKPAAEAAGVPFIQEVVANSVALVKYFGNVGTAIELGGQDAKILFFRKDEVSGKPVVEDMRMNGSCAGGTGAFIDEIASILRVPPEEFSALAEKGTTVYDISGRCGVFAKTDIQPLLNQGVPLCDLAVSTYHAIAKQSIGGLAQGLKIRPPVAFEGGPLTFHPALVRVFKERLNLRDDEVLLPERPEMMVACGAALGSRCTVFMNSSIITEQRNGKGPGDIMAGLCRSIIENVFTKVIRVSNIASLGEHIVVQGGTFRNDAVLRAMEQYIGKRVTRAPYPGLMGAIGAALLVKEQTEEAVAAGTFRNTFIGLDALERFYYTQESNLRCPFCGNHCSRTVVRFPNGNSWITNNRCERGEILGDPGEEAVREKLAETEKKRNSVPDLFEFRKKLLFREYPAELCAPERETVIGLPRVLSTWEYAPFWTTFFRSLGFRVKLSPESSRRLYESGLPAVTSDTVCFPAKLVHGHLRALKEMGVDRIFMPSVTAVQPENPEKTSESMCAVVKGYPIVVRNSDNPHEMWGIPFDAPLFHWHRKEDMHRQLKWYMEKEFGIPARSCEKALRQAEAAQESFHESLFAEGRRVLEQAEREGGFAVVLASRPYQNDALVNHGISRMFTSMGIPVLTADAVPGVNKVDLSRSRLDIVNNFHARMLGSAVIAAQTPALEYVQLVSFGCGHDAYLTDEIIRLMDEISGKTPLVLKMDESDVPGPLRIRVRSFAETVRMRRKRAASGENDGTGVKCLQDPYPVKFMKKDVKERVVLVPNTSHAFCEILSAAFRTQHIRAVPLPVGYEEAAQYGKRYVHNDICFPAQVVIGEILSALKSGKYEAGRVAVAMAKYIGDCRLTHYSALLRKALDDAGFREVPIITNDQEDARGLHPGFRMNLLSQARLAFSLPMIDVLEELLRKTRPYELEKGSADRSFAQALREVIQGLDSSPGIRGLKEGFRKAIGIMNGIRCDFSRKKPTVLIVGEYLLNFHPGANHEIERYLEKNGFEVIEARMTDVIRKTYFYQNAQVKEYHIKKSFRERTMLQIQDSLFDLAQNVTDAIAGASPLYRPAARMQDIVKESDPLIHHTFDAGEGVLIPGEILHHAKEGCRSFILLQPFGCLPNHVVGRGIAKKLKEIYPDARILPLDFDPDVSAANLENRLQMLIMDGAVKAS